MTPLLIKSFAATVAIAAFSIVRADVGGVRAAAANADPLIGVTGSLDTEAGGMADLTQVGWAEVRAGGPVAFGDQLTADAQGCAVKAVPVNGVVVRTIGTAMLDADLGDVFPLHVVPGVIA